MKTIFFKSALVFGIIVLAIGELHAQQRNCGTMDLLQTKFKRNPALKVAFDKKQAELLSYIQQRQLNRGNERVLAAPAVIPIVFHIVMKDPSVVSDTQVLAQLDTINKDYAGLNGDSVRIPSAFKSVFGKSNISFCLAKRTPTGEPTTGIDRFVTTKDNFSNTDNESVKHNALGGEDAWDPSKYLNIWICDLAGDLLGYGTFPNSTSADEQGVVIDYECIPGGSLSGFNKGKTLTHEIGHYFNLYHTWGDDDGACTGTDFIADTPNQANSTAGCPTGVKTDACTMTSPGIMYENYMDYTADDCLVMFTADQVDRMETAVTTSRASLLTSDGCLPAVLENYDAQPRLINNPSSRVCDPTFTPSVTIFNRGALTLTSLTIDAKIDNGTVISTNWTGSIASLDTQTVALSSLTIGAGTHLLTIWSSNPDGSVDQDVTNDTLTMTVSYQPPVIAPLSESFEGSTFPPVGWDIVNPDGLVTWQKISGYAKTGNSSVYMNNINYEITDQKDYLRLPVLNLGTADSAFISFQVAAAVYNDPTDAGRAWDTLEVVASTDCGKTYTSLYKKWGTNLITRAGATATDFYPSSSEWRKDSVDISSYIAQGEVMLAFRSTNEWQNNIFLDDINVRTVNVNPNLKDQGFLATPSPTTGSLTVQFYPQPDKLKGIAIFSSVGQRVAETVISTGQANNYYNYDLSHFAPGVYIVRAYFTDKTITKKILLVH
ncbi:MAG: M43 family zinc metalloprotease [Chitinophagaceae bacterium]